MKKESNLQKILSVLYDWRNKWQMKVNVNKQKLFISEKQNNQYVINIEASYLTSILASKVVHKA